MSAPQLPPPKVIRVLLADDHTVVRQAIATLLGSYQEIEVVSCVADADAAVRATLGHKPDVAILDLHMPRAEDTLRAIPKVIERSPQTGVVVLTMDDTRDAAVAAIRAGAIGYVLKEVADRELIDAVQSASRGQGHLTPRIGAELTQVPMDGESGTDALSDRERDIITLTALGHTSREIGQTLFLSVRTVETHRANLNAKLGFATRVDLVKFALAHGLIDRESRIAAA